MIFALLTVLAIVWFIAALAAMPVALDMARGKALQPTKGETEWPT